MRFSCTTKHFTGIYEVITQTFIAENSSRGIVGVRMSDGLDPVAFRQILEKMIRPRVAIKNQDEVVGAMEFEYTFWAKPDNKSAVRQNLIDVRTVRRLRLCNW